MTEVIGKVISLSICNYRFLHWGKKRVHKSSKTNNKLGKNIFKKRDEYEKR